MNNGKKNTISSKLRLCRTNCGLSQQQVADALSINRTTYTYYESGRSEPNLNMLVKLAQIFCVDISSLLPSEAADAPLRDLSDDTPNPIYSLTRDEQNLLLNFRLLSNDDKDEILAKITKMVKSSQ